MDYVFRDERIFTSCYAYYGISDKFSNTVRMVVELDEEVDGAMLRRAIDRTCERYPYLCVRRVNTQKETYLAHNLESVVCKHTMDRVDLGDAAAKEHLMAFSYWGKCIYFNYFHAILEGESAIKVMKTLLFYYCRERYDENLSPQGIQTLQDEILPEEYIDPLREYHFDKAMRSKLIKLKAKPFCIFRDDPKVTPTESFLYCLKVPEKEFVAFCKANHGSPTVVLALFLAKTIDLLNPDRTKPIISGMAQSMRAALGASRSHHSMVDDIKVIYDERVKQADFETQCRIYRSVLKEHSDREETLVRLRGQQSTFRTINSLPSRMLKKRFWKRVITKQLGGVSGTVSYVGKTDYGALEPYVKSFYTEVESVGNGIMMEANTADGSFCLTWVQEFHEDLYLKEFMRRFEEAGISCEITRAGTYVAAKCSE